MPFNKTALANLGGTEMHKGEFRAHLQYRNEFGTNINIRGPNRTTEDEAQKDLQQFVRQALLGQLVNKVWKLWKQNPSEFRFLLSIKSKSNKQYTEWLRKMLLKVMLKSMMTI